MAAGATGAGPQDEDDEDDDYVPDQDMNEEDEEVSGLERDSNDVLGCNLSESKRRAVDDAFEELFGYKFGTSFRAKRRRRDDTKGTSSEEDRRLDLLERVFGAARAAKLLSTSSSVVMQRQLVRRAPRPSASGTNEMVTETRVFAGKEIQVQRRALGRQEAKKDGLKPPPADSATNPKGIDSLLQKISGPNQLSTVAKTSADWDSFKTEAGMEEQLEQQAQGKGAFLVKQDFLQRVDERRFEHERTKRDQERAKRGK